MQINGIAHLALTVGRFELCVPFYEALMKHLGLQQVFKGDNHLYFVGGKTAVALYRCAEQHAGERFVQVRPGLHHVCFRARSREDIDETYRFLQSLNATIVHPPEEGPWGPGYYSLLFEDPDGIRLELNHVPGKGILEQGTSFNPASDYS
jgi:catechol 2,3-dioxygenase-like lactoylglutathione lyase family enzyme